MRTSYRAQGPRDSDGQARSANIKLKKTQVAAECPSLMFGNDGAGGIPKLIGRRKARYPIVIVAPATGHVVTIGPKECVVLHSYDLADLELRRGTLQGVGEPLRHVAIRVMVLSWPTHKAT